jgi:hypothetical protein
MNCWQCWTRHQHRSRHHRHSTHRCHRCVVVCASHSTTLAHSRATCERCLHVVMTQVHLAVSQQCHASSSSSPAPITSIDERRAAVDKLSNQPQNITNTAYLLNIIEYSPHSADTLIVRCCGRVIVTLFGVVNSVVFGDQRSHFAIRRSS